jgi:hypothetical protein
MLKLRRLSDVKLWCHVPQSVKAITVSNIRIHSESLSFWTLSIVRCSNQHNSSITVSDSVLRLGQAIIYSVGCLESNGLNRFSVPFPHFT